MVHFIFLTDIYQTVISDEFSWFLFGFGEEWVRKCVQRFYTLYYVQRCQIATRLRVYQYYECHYWITKIDKQIIEPVDLHLKVLQTSGCIKITKINMRLIISSSPPPPFHMWFCFFNRMFPLRSNASRFSFNVSKCLNS